MRKRIPLFLALSFMVLTANVPPLRADAIPLDSYAAMVNTRVITTAEVLAIVQPIEWQLRQTYTGRDLETKLEEAYRNALDALIDHALIIEEFKSRDGDLPNRAVDDYVNSIIHERFEGSRAKFFDALAAERLTYDEWRNQMKERLVVSMMRREEVNNRIVVSPGQVRAVYEETLDRYRTPEQVHLRVIVVNRGESEDDRQTKRAQAQEILDRLRDGEDFAALARQVSEGIKAAEGGDLGWVQPKDLREELREALSSLDVGAISDVIDAGDQFYIVRLEARRTTAVKPFDEVRDAIEETLRRQEGERLYDAWIQRLKNRFYVKVYEEEES